MSECHVVRTYPRARKLLYSYSKDYANFGSGSPPPSPSVPVPPDSHGPPVSSLSSWGSFTYRVTLAKFAPLGKSRAPSESVVVNITVPGSYQHRAFVAQADRNEGDVWIADYGAS